MESRLQRIATILSWIKTSIAPSKNVTISRIGQFTRILLYFRNAASEKIHFYSPLNLIHVYVRARVFLQAFHGRPAILHNVRDREASSSVFQISWLEASSFDGRYLSSCLRLVSLTKFKAAKKLKGMDINFLKTVVKWTKYN